MTLMSQSSTPMDTREEIWKHPGFETFHNWNIYVAGIHNYYRGMTRFNKSFSKIGWRIRKLFYHTMEKRAAFTDEQSYKNNFPHGRYSSWGKSGYYCFDRFPVVEIDWANWDSPLIASRKGNANRGNPYNYGKNKQQNISCYIAAIPSSSTCRILKSGKG